jgi:hypothetical protein
MEKQRAYRAGRRRTATPAWRASQEVDGPFNWFGGAHVPAPRVAQHQQDVYAELMDAMQGDRRAGTNDDGWEAPRRARLSAMPAFLALAALGAVLTAVAVAAEADVTAPEVRWSDGRLSVRIESVPLDDVLAAVARETGLEIFGEPLDRREVNKRFDALPLSEALVRLVGRQNFVLRFGAGGEPDRLELLGVPQAPQKPARVRGVQALKLLLKHGAVPVPPNAARALGGSSLRLHHLLRGLRHANPLVRSESATAILRAIESDAELLAAFRAIEPSQLAQLLGSQTGGHANEVATTFYRSARDPLLRSRLALARAVVLAQSRPQQGT